MSNARWLILSQAGKITLQLVALFVLSRLLQPSEYGLLAMALVATNFASILRDSGMGAAVVQKRELTDETLNTVFWLNVGLGTVLALLLALLSPLLEHFFKAPNLGSVLCVLAIAFPISGTSALHQSLLERDSKFRTVVRIEMSSAVLGLCVAIALALNGAGVYSLVAQAVAIALLTTLQLWFASTWRPRMRWSYSEFKELWRFSGNLTGFTFINFFSRNADSMVIGRMLGSIQLGIYSQAYKVMMFPLQNMTYVASRALFPVMSRHQDDRVKMSALYYKSLRLIATATAPLMAGLWVLRDPFVIVALGNKWAGVADILAWMAPIGLVQSINSTTGTVFMASGNTRLLMRIGVISAVLQVSSFVIGVRWGLTGVTACYLVANVLACALSLYLVVKVLGTGITALLQSLWQPLAFSALMLTVLSPAYAYLQSKQSDPSVSLALIGVLGAAVFASCTFLFSKGLVHDCKQMLGGRK
ncbi:MAG: MOP flippase family protein [Pseudomonadota bacterium]